MGCKYARICEDDSCYFCAISGNQCMYVVPDSKRCSTEYSEIPDADENAAK